jgi:hypothetical protein
MAVVWTNFDSADTRCQGMFIRVKNSNYFISLVRNGAGQTIYRFFSMAGDYSSATPEFAYTTYNHMNAYSYTMYFDEVRNVLIYSRED